MAAARRASEGWADWQVPIRRRVLQLLSEASALLHTPIQRALALQLLLLRVSESMGNHDSNVVGAGRVG